jgi:hypothetical protein
MRMERAQCRDPTSVFGNNYVEPSGSITRQLVTKLHFARDAHSEGTKCKA